MLLQRLVVDPKIGFNYDYMGYAEFEFGATTTARTALAELWLDKAMCTAAVSLKTQDEQVDVAVFGSADVIARLTPVTTIRWEKSGLRVDQPKIVGWMGVHSLPVIFLRDVERRVQIDRLERFLRPAVDWLEEQRAVKEPVA